MNMLLEENRKAAGRPARFVALLTAVLLLAALIPMSGIAPDTAAFADTIPGSGYEFNDSTGELTVNSDEGTTNWRDDGIDQSMVKDIVIQDGVTRISDRAFALMWSLQSVKFSDCTSLTEIDEYAFSNSCMRIESIDLSDCTKLTSIGDNAFGYCGRLDNVTFPASLRTIGNNAFYACQSLVSVNLGGCTSLTTIGDYVFHGCPKLDNVIFPASLQKIGNEAFFYCQSLTSVDLSDCTKLTSIADGAFGYCSRLDNVTLPASLQTIGDTAFQGCTDLSVLRFLGAIAPTVGTNAFDNVSDTGTLYYPKDAKGYDVIMSLFADWDMVSESSDAGLASVAGQFITAGSQTGTKDAPKTASISVANSVTGIGLSDIVTSDDRATKHIYSERNFSAGAASISLTAGADTHVYVKVVAEDTVTTLYYDVTVTKADAVPNLPGGGNTPGGGGDNNNTPNLPGGDRDNTSGGGDSEQALTKADAIKASQKTVYIAKGKKAVLPYIVYGSVDANQAKVTLNWKASNKKVASVKNIRNAEGSIQASVNKNQTLTIKAGKKLGTSKISLTSPNGKRLIITVKVVKNAKQMVKNSVKIKKLPKGKAMTTGQSRTLRVAFTKKATAIVTWKSSKPGVIKIDASGKITALKKGTATITLKVGGKTQKVAIKVKK